MANRFPDLEKEELHKILDDKDSKNTKAAIKSAETVLMDYVKQKQLDIGEVGSRNLKDQDIFLETFYASIRKKDKSLYKKKSFQLIRWGVARFWKAKFDTDILCKKTFTKSNGMYAAMLAKIQADGLGQVKRKPVIEQEDLNKMYSYFLANMDSPMVLQQKVFVDVMLHLCRRGRENLRDMTKETFAIRQDASGSKYVYKAVSEFDKNHRGDDDKPEGQGQMHEIPGL